MFFKTIALGGFAIMVFNFFRYRETALCIYGLCLVICGSIGPYLVTDTQKLHKEKVHYLESHPEILLSCTTGTLLAGQEEYLVKDWSLEKESDKILDRQTNRIFSVAECEPLKVQDRARIQATGKNITSGRN